MGRLGPGDLDVISSSKSSYRNVRGGQRYRVRDPRQVLGFKAKLELDNILTQVRSEVRREL